MKNITKYTGTEDIKGVQLASLMLKGNRFEPDLQNTPFMQTSVLYRLCTNQGLKQSYDARLLYKKAFL